VSNVVEQSREERLTGAAAFRQRMERQCQQIRLYRLAKLRDCGRLLTLDEAAMEWIEQYASTFDGSRTGP
jgi:hypothetical protein